MYAWLTQPYLVVSLCDMMEKKCEKMQKNVKQNSTSDAHSTEIYPYIPAIPWYGYVVWSGYAKYNTVPVPTEPVTQNLQVFPYLCGTLFASGNRYHPRHELETVGRATHGCAPPKQFIATARLEI
jgi:hypothetical protein